MKLRSVPRIFLLTALLVNFLGASTPAQAKGLFSQIVIRSTTFWDATFNGNVNANRFERWSLQIDETSSFSITVTTTSGDLTPKIALLDAAGDEISSVLGTLSTAVLNATQDSGDYFIQIEPADNGSGDYSMEIRRTDNQSTDSHATIVFNPASVFPNETSTASVFLNNVPANGYASAEFTCTYDSAVISISDIADAGLFGTDPVVIINGPSSGSFLFAVAGSNGRKAEADGAAFTFTVTALQVGETEVDCEVRVSTGGALQIIEFTPMRFTVLEPLGMIEGVVQANKPVTVTLYNSDDEVVDSTLVDANGFFTFQAPAGTYLIKATAESFLPAEGDPVLTSGNTTTMQTISLVSGDIDGNGVIDQFDALTIGMNYNASNVPAADLNNDGIINVLDLEILALNYRANGSLNWPVNP